MSKTIEQLETENKMLRLQLQELHEKEAVLNEWIKNNENELTWRLDDMEKEYTPHDCTLCMGDCHESV